MIIPIILSLIFFITTIIFLILYIKKDENSNIKINKSYYTPRKEQYIPVIQYMDTEGADEYQGNYDILNSRYFKAIDFYNMKNSGSLIILEKFKTYQQTSNSTCGCASLIMCAYYIDGKIINESECAIKAKYSQEIGIFPENLEKAVAEYGYDYESKRRGFKEGEAPSYDEETFAEYIKNSLKNNEPIIILSNDWSGHYTVIIGYDDMGNDNISDDVVIVADPFDTSDHICDGYVIWSYERLYFQMVVEYLKIDDMNYEFIRVKKKE